MTFVQYIVVRRDLSQILKWPTGAIIAQSCHACSAVFHLFRNDPNMQEYTANVDRMHKIVLEAKDEECLKKLASTLEENQIDHKLWIEQPENIPTCIATKPYRKEDVQKYFKPFKLYK